MVDHTETTSVKTWALRQIFDALNGPSYLIRELIALRGLGSLGVASPIDEIERALRPLGRGRKWKSGRKAEPAVTKNPLLRQMFELIDRQEKSMTTLAQQAGYARNSLSRWRRLGGAKLEAVEDVLELMGYHLTIVPLAPAGSGETKQQTQNGVDTHV